VRRVTGGRCKQDESPSPRPSHTCWVLSLRALVLGVRDVGRSWHGIVCFWHHPIHPLIDLIVQVGTTTLHISHPTLTCLSLTIIPPGLTQRTIHWFPLLRPCLRGLGSGLSGKFDLIVSWGMVDISSLLIQAAVQDNLDDDSEMRKMFLDEVKEEDNRITDAWKEDANSIVMFVSLNLQLVFMFISMTSSKTGHFSAIVGAFIIEFYKNLSSASGDQKVALLQQISRQLPTGQFPK
jgi:hypothetical protein